MNGGVRHVGTRYAGWRYLEERSHKLGASTKNYGKSYSDVFLTLKSKVATPDRHAPSSEDGRLCRSLSVERSSNDSAVVAQHLACFPAAGGHDQALSSHLNKLNRCGMSLEKT